MVTPREAWRTIEKTLSEAGVEDAGFETDVLLRHVAGTGRLGGDALSAPQWETLQALAARRARREPLQYILGEWDFLHLTLAVGPGVLIPRPETESVCLAAAELLAGIQAPRALDLCSGSGALALGLQSLVPGAQVTAVEYSPEAFAYLEKNVAAFAAAGAQNVPVCVPADALAWHREAGEAAFDLIVCNPPYVTEAEYAALAPELRFEPKQALVPPNGDGLAFYRAIARGYRKTLRPGGWLVFEIGAGQGAALREILAANGYEETAIRPDLAGHDRIALARRP